MIKNKSVYGFESDGFIYYTEFCNYDFSVLVHEFAHIYYSSFDEKGRMKLREYTRQMLSEDDIKRITDDIRNRPIKVSLFEEENNGIENGLERDRFETELFSTAISERFAKICDFLPKYKDADEMAENLPIDAEKLLKENLICNKVIVDVVKSFCTPTEINKIEVVFSDIKNKEIEENVVENDIIFAKFMLMGMLLLMLNEKKLDYMKYYKQEIVDKAEELLNNNKELLNDKDFVQMLEEVKSLVSKSEEKPKEEVEVVAEKKDVKSKRTPKSNSKEKTKEKASKKQPKSFNELDEISKGLVITEVLENDKYEICDVEKEEFFEMTYDEIIEKFYK